MQHVIQKALSVLKDGGLILYPTDTVWGIGCDATNSEAVAKVYDLKQRENSKALICLVANDAMLERHLTSVPDIAYDILDIATKPTTIVYDQPKGIAPNLIATDNSLAIRVTKNKFCSYLISAFKKPIVSTSANIAGEPTPRSFDEISTSIKDGVDYIAMLEQESPSNAPSTIIKIGMDSTVKIIRK